MSKDSGAVLLFALFLMSALCMMFVILIGLDVRLGHFTQIVSHQRNEVLLMQPLLDAAEKFVTTTNTDLDASFTHDMWHSDGEKGSYRILSVDYKPFILNPDFSEMGGGIHQYDIEAKLKLYPPLMVEEIYNVLDIQIMDIRSFIRKVFLLHQMGEDLQLSLQQSDSVSQLQLFRVRDEGRELLWIHRFSTKMTQMILTLGELCLSSDKRPVVWHCLKLKDGKIFVEKHSMKGVSIFRNKWKI